MKIGEHNTVVLGKVGSSFEVSIPAELAEQLMLKNNRPIIEKLGEGELIYANPVQEDINSRGLKIVRGGKYYKRVTVSKENAAVLSWKKGCRLVAFARDGHLCYRQMTSKDLGIG